MKPRFGWAPADSAWWSRRRSSGSWVSRCRRLPSSPCPRTRRTRCRTSSARNSSQRMPSWSAPDSTTPKRRGRRSCRSRPSVSAAWCWTPSHWACCRHPARRPAVLLILNPNAEEAAILLERDLADDRACRCRRDRATLRRGGQLLRHGRRSGRVDVASSGWRTGIGDVRQRRCPRRFDRRVRRAGCSREPCHGLGKLGARSRGRSPDRATRNRLSCT